MMKNCKNKVTIQMLLKYEWDRNMRDNNVFIYLSV